MPFRVGLRDADAHYAGKALERGYSDISTAAMRMADLDNHFKHSEKP